MNNFYKKAAISILTIVITVLAFSGLTACSNSKESQESARSTYVDEHANKNTSDSESGKNEVEGTEWEVVAKGTLPSSANRFVIYRDTKTDVIWVLQNSWYGDGGSSFSPRVNADGTYMTYQQYLEKGNNLDNADVLEDQS